MSKCLKKILIVVLAFCCAFAVQLSVSAIDIGDIGDLGNVDLEDLQQWITNIFTPSTTTTENAEETTTDSSTQANPDETTTEETTTDIINNSGTVISSTTSEPVTVSSTMYDTMYYYAPTQVSTTLVAETTTAEPAGDESNSLSFEASLSDLFEDDSAAVIIQPQTETYTIGNLVVKDNDNDSGDSFTWQKAALVAAAVLFVVFLALITALVIQRSKRAKEDEYIGVRTDDSGPSGPVPVEVMSQERIAELLGATAIKNSRDDYHELSSEESAAAIKAAALMGQLSSYSDPLIRKYTDEPVMISPSAAAALENENATVSEILRATDAMLDDITGGELFASDVSGYRVPVSSTEPERKTGAARVCPDCGNSVPAEDVFCHNCGTYIG